MFKIQDLFDKYGSFFNIMCTFWFAVKFPFNVQKRLYCEKRLLLPYPSSNCWTVAFTNPPAWFITTVCSLYGVQYTGDFHIWKGQCHKTFDPFFRKNLGSSCKLFYFREDIREIACLRYQQLCRDGNACADTDGEFWRLLTDFTGTTTGALFGNWWQVSIAVANCCRFDFFLR